MSEEHQRDVAARGAELRFERGEEGGEEYAAAEAGRTSG
jgi:hypothetical protein